MADGRIRHHGRAARHRDRPGPARRGDRRAQAGPAGALRRGRGLLRLSTFRPGLLAAERRGLDPVLAGGRAEAAGRVARGVDVDPVAPRRGADPEPAVQIAAEHHGQPGGAPGGPAGDQRVLGSVEVQVPRLAVVPVQARAGACAVQHAVDQAGRGVGAPGRHRVEDLPDLSGHGAEPRGLARRHVPGVGSAFAQRRGHRGGQRSPARRQVRPAVRLTGGERVGQPDRHGHDRIHVTGEIHLTSYVLAPSFVTVEIIIASDADVRQ